jgi:hypothetical protein
LDLERTRATERSLAWPTSSAPPGLPTSTDDDPAQPLSRDCCWAGSRPYVRSCHLR